LPMALLLHRAFVRTPRDSKPVGWTILGLLGILFLPPLHLWALRAGVYALMSLPLLALFLAIASFAQQEKARPTI